EMTDQAITKEASATPRMALVTGASRGIGRGIAIELARSGFDLIINYRANHEAADRARTLALGASGRERARISTFRADISEAADRDALLSFARSQSGHIDLLVNNAGIGPEVRTDLLEASEESFDRLIKVNLKGPYFLTQAVARWMIEGVASTQHNPADRPYRPMIVNIGSISAYAASPDRGDYCVSKAGLSMMTTVFAARLAQHGIN